MKTIASVVLSVAAAIAPSFVFAQSQGGPLTRAQVTAELVQLERAGYSPASGENATYPADIQAAEAKVAAQNAQEAYGGTQSGRSAAGAPEAMRRGGS
ncbi:DUF4148 domain-containing protein [Caballeronia sp. LZ062]|uniref:DUF4148 domain-containing protein n=1 Tax=unclassified Caballeronia TaxID=2646786 RepID=UPI0028596FD8|nr:MULTISPECIES: DUF4148 domain-containing protein [unclassified Caballeronia]MDR5857242.1 DUF4148 domain-containing protein [Caballeronia sp. LZ050]MDR5869362.1 DUF4148 domain-containing protein [Caballeronia sp. LZ062]